MNILLIEPDYVLAELYQRVLQNDGHLVELCRSAQAAIYHCDTALPDIIILELQLPQHNGVEFLYELRSYPEWQAVPVLLLTAVPPVDALSPMLWRQLNITSYLYKPVTTLATLSKTVREVAASVST